MKQARPPRKAGGPLFLLNKMKHLASLLAFILIFNQSNTIAGINEEVEKLLADSLFSGSSVGVSIIDITSDSAIYGWQADKYFTPASNLKLFTSAAALGILGPGFRFKTEFQYRGTINKRGRLEGDLIVVGGGDPLISGRSRPRVTEVLELWADSLKARGIRGIKGRLIADNSFFAPPELGPGWSWDDLSYWYACPISALSFNDNCVDLKFLPGKKAGDPAIIKIDPVTDYISIQNNAVTLRSESSFTLDYYRSPDDNKVTFFGGISLSDTAGEKDYVSIYRPELYTLSVFNDILMSKGIKTSNKFCALEDLDSEGIAKYNKEDYRQLFEWRSDSLGAILKVINTNSQNLFAEQMLKTLGAIKEGKGTFKSGVLAVQAYLDSIGITGRDIMMYDGSGLSYMNAVKPEAITKLLASISRAPYFELFYESLANPAKDKAARNRLKDNPDRGNVRAKSGNIAGVSTFSGYVKGPKSGHLLAFSIMINKYNCDRAVAEGWEDSLVAELLKEY